MISRERLVQLAQEHWDQRSANHDDVLMGVEFAETILSLAKEYEDTLQARLDCAEVGHVIEFPTHLWSGLTSGMDGTKFSGWRSGDFECQNCDAVWRQTNKEQV